MAHGMALISPPVASCAVIPSAGVVMIRFNNIFFPADKGIILGTRYGYL